MLDEKVNILLVDDQPAKLLTYQAILADVGENLLSANNATEALELLLKNDVAVVLIDVYMVARPGLYSLASLLLVIALSFGYAQLEPRYRLADQVPDREQAVLASHKLDAKLTGANPFDVYIQFPKGASLYAPETLAVIADVHALLEHQQGIGNVWSLDTLRRWLAEKLRKSDVETLKQYVDLLPPYLTRRFISAEQDAVIVSGRVPDDDASQLLPIVDRVDRQLNTLRAKYPGYKIAVTGLSVIAARNSALMTTGCSKWAAVHASRGLLANTRSSAIGPSACERGDGAGGLSSAGISSTADSVRNCSLE